MSQLSEAQDLIASLLIANHSASHLARSFTQKYFIAVHPVAVSALFVALFISSTLAIQSTIPIQAKAQARHTAEVSAFSRADVLLMFPSHSIS